MDKKSGQLKSRIRPTLLEGSVVTATRTNLHYVVTEYGKFNAKGKSTWERAEGPDSVWKRARFSPPPWIKKGQLKSCIRPTLEGSGPPGPMSDGVRQVRWRASPLQGLIREELIAEAEKMHIWRRSNKR